MRLCAALLLVAATVPPEVWAVARVRAVPLARTTTTAPIVRIAPPARLATAPLATIPLAKTPLLGAVSAAPQAAAVVPLAAWEPVLAPATADAPEGKGKADADARFDGAAPKPAGPEPVAAAPSSAKRAWWARKAAVPGAAVNKPLRVRAVESWRSSMPDGAKRLVVGTFLWNFLTIGSYSMIGPARAALVSIKFGPDAVPLIYMASAVLTGVVVYFYNKASHLSRGRLVGGSLAMLAATMAGGAAAVHFAASPALTFAYTLWTDVFGIMSVTLLWSYANDVFTKEESKRSFGLIAAGAPLGGILGALTAKLIIGTAGPVGVLLLASAVFSAALPLFFVLERLAKGRGAKHVPTDADGDGKPDPISMKAVLGIITGSAFLTQLLFMVFGERFVPDVIGYLFNKQVTAVYGKDGAAIGQLFADVNFWTSLASFFTSSFLARPIMNRFGFRGSLVTAPLASLAFLAAYLLAPGWLGAAMVLWGLEGVTRYTTFKTAKESLYSARDRATIYPVKAFVEMFGYRFARGLAGLAIMAAWKYLGMSPAGIALAGAAFGLAWLSVAWKVGARQEAEHAAAKK